MGKSDIMISNDYIQYHQMIYTKLILLGMFLVFAYSQPGQDLGSVFANTFNIGAPLSPPSTNTTRTSTPTADSSNIVSTVSAQAASAPLNTNSAFSFSGSPYSSDVTRTVSTTSSPTTAPLFKNPAENAFSQIKASAALFKRPSRTVIGSQNKQIYLLFIDETGSVFRAKIASKTLANRLLDSSKTFLTVEQNTLNMIPEFTNVDKYAQLISSKDQQQVFLAQHSEKRPISESVFNQFGFAKSKVLQVEPCHIQLFSDGDWIR